MAGIGVYSYIHHCCTKPVTDSIAILCIRTLVTTLSFDLERLQPTTSIASIPVYSHQSPAYTDQLWISHKVICMHAQGWAIG